MPVTRECVLITGGSGFIGANLARELISVGHDVHLILRPQANLWRLAGLETSCTIHRADLLDAAAVRAAVAACRPQVIYHLATHGAYAFQKERAEILATNLLGTANLLGGLEHIDYKCFVNVGTSSEYGHKNAPMRETDVLVPRSDYAVSKAAATLLCQSEAFRGRPITTVRVFSAYGPWEDSRRLVPSVMASCLRGEAPQVTAGWQPRDFIHVDDVVSLLQAAAHRPAARGRILHAGTGRARRVCNMIEAIVTVSGGRVTPKYGEIPTRNDEPTVWVADITQTSAITGWRPQFDLRAGVERTWSWFVREAPPAQAA